MRVPQELRAMQAVILKFPVANSMVLSNTEKIDALEKRADALGERIAKAEALSHHPEPHRNPLITWLPLVAAVAAIVGSILVATNHIDSELSSMRTDISGLTTRTTKNEAAIKALSDQQSDATQKLIHDLLATAVTTKSLPIATKAVEVASRLTSQLREEKRPAPPEFFQSVVESLNHTKQPELKDAAFRVQLQLAEYRSSLLTISVPSTVMNCMGDAAKKESFPVNYIFTDMTFNGCVFTLDGRHLNHVVLINTRVIYNGGPLYLDKVVFVNCTFDVKPSSNASQFLEYATLEQQELALGS
jgi:hypothetical protein